MAKTGSENNKYKNNMTMCYRGSTGNMQHQHNMNMNMETTY